MKWQSRVIAYARQSVKKNHDTKNRLFVLCEERIHVYFTEISGTAHGHDHVAVSVEHHDRLPGGIRFRRAPLTGKIMAEGGGFEPPVDLRLHNLSKVAPSTTRTPLRSQSGSYYTIFSGRKATLNVIKS